jgi:hypothetical protein
MVKTRVGTALLGCVRLGQKRLKITNTPSYYKTELVNIVKKDLTEPYSFNLRPCLIFVGKTKSRLHPKGRLLALPVSIILGGR